MQRMWSGFLHADQHQEILLLLSVRQPGLSERFETAAVGKTAKPDLQGLRKNLYPQAVGCGLLLQRPLAAGVAAVDRIRPLGGKGFSATLANPILPFFQPPLFQIFLITPVPAQIIIAIFLGADLHVEDPAAPFADDPPYSQVRFRTRDFFFIPLSQRFLILIFPIAVPHELCPSLDGSKKGGA